MDIMTVSYTHLYNLCEERENRENEVVLKKENEKWIVYVTDERALSLIHILKYQIYEYGRRNKKAYMDWSEKGVSYLNGMYVYDIMMDVDEALQTCCLLYTSRCV